MPDSALTVKIVADTTDLPTKMAMVKAELSAAASAAQKTAKAWVGASGEIKDALAVELQAQTATVTVLKTEQAELRAELLKTQEEAKGSQSIFAKMNESVLSLGEQAEAVTSKISAFTGAFGKVNELVATGFGVEVLADQVREVGELGEAYEHMQAQTGASLSALGGLKIAAMETGTDFDQLGNGLRELGTKMQDAVVHPSSESAEAFKKLGVSITDSSGQMLPIVDVFQQISTKMAEFQDGTAKTALAGDVLGQKYGESLIPVMNSVGTNFDELKEKGQALGVTMSQQQVEASLAFMESLNDTQGALIGLRTTVVAGNLPAFTALSEELVTASQQGGILHDAADVLDIGLKAVADVSVAVVTALTEIADGANFAGQVMGDTAVIAWGLAEALTGHFEIARAAVHTATTDIANDWTAMLSNMSAQEKLFTTTDSALWNGTPGPGVQSAPDNVIKPPAPQLSPDLPKGGGGASAARSDQDQVTQIAQDAAQARKEIQQSELEAQISTWQAEVAQGKLTNAAEIQDEQAAQQAIYTADLAEAQKEVALAPMGSVARAKALDDEQVMMAQHVATMAQLNEQLVEAQVEAAKAKAEAEQEAAEKAKEAWQQTIQPIEMAMDGMLNGILQGTQTVRQAELKVAQDVTLAVIDAEAKKALSYAASQAEMLAKGVTTQAGLTAATIAGNQAQIAVTETATAEKNSLNIIAATKAVLSNAATAASGAYAAEAGIPIVGPALGAAAAAATFTAVMAYDVLSASGGLALGPGQNPLVQLHENEMVLPSYIARPLTAMATSGDVFNQSGGDTSYTNHFQTTVHGSGSGAVEKVFAAMNSAARNGGFPAKYSALNRWMRRGN